MPLDWQFNSKPAVLRDVLVLLDRLVMSMKDQVKLVQKDFPMNALGTASPVQVPHGLPPGVKPKAAIAMQTGTALGFPAIASINTTHVLVYTYAVGTMDVYVVL